jgi:hypothetical protein
MATGEFGNVDVPKKAIQAQGIIYQASTMMSVAAKAGIPIIPVTEMDVKWDIVKGVVGKDDVAVDAYIDPSKLEYKPISTKLKWSNYTYMILEGAKLSARDPKSLWKDSLMAASEFFAAIRDYRALTALVAGAGNSGAATDTWDAAGADVEVDIVTAINKIAEESNIQSGEKISVVIPAKVGFEVQKLTLINNIQRTIKDYLEKSFQLEIIPFRPFIDTTGTAQFDALSTNALVFVQGQKTAMGLEYSLAEATRRGIITVEHSRVHGRGDMYTQKMCTGALVTWDGIQTYSETVPLTARIYKITGVTS